MEKHVKGLLSVLRQAINEAILGSHDVSAALAALGRTGNCPTFAVDVSIEAQPREGDQPPLFAESRGELILTGADEEFLRSLGIKVDTSAGAAIEAH
jgi:hypothetical protein